jgi:hypothetical protein
MKTIFRNLTVSALLWAAVSASAAGEVVEEETWYNAEGEVVKKVKRTLTGADAQESADWEPQWVTREKQRGKRAVRYSSPRGYGYGYGYRPSYWGSGSYYSSPRYSCPERRGRSGFTGYHRVGGTGSRWAVGYRSRGLSIRYCR